MNLNNYQFDFERVDMSVDNKLLQMAIDRGFYNGKTRYNELFSTLFFSGGKLDLKKGYSPTMLQYIKQFMGSFAPKQEEKEAICAMLLCELVV